VDSSTTPTPVSTGGSNQNSTPSQEAATETKTRRKTDPAWDYCIEIVEGEKKKIKCMYCNITFQGGGIHRFKEHLAKWPGNVAACKKVNPKTEHTMYKNIEDWNERKKKQKEEYVEGHPYGPEPGEEDVVEVSNTNIAASNKGKKRPAATPSLGKYFKPRTGPGDQPTIRSVLQGEAVKEKTDMCVARWFFDASIPFNATNSVFYQPMFDAVAAFGSGYKAPSMRQLRGPYLAKCVEKK
jgi:hypothetical protein